MDENTITALAREYAEETGKEFPTAFDIKQRNMENHLLWLCDRYCLVEKSKAANLCRLALENGASEDYGLIDGLTDIVCEIFPEQYEQETRNPDHGKEVEG